MYEQFDVERGVAPQHSHTRKSLFGFRCWRVEGRRCPACHVDNDCRLVTCSLLALCCLLVIAFAVVDFALHEISIDQVRALYERQTALLISGLFAGAASVLS